MSAPVPAGTLFIHQGCSIPQKGVQISAQRSPRQLPPAATRARCDEKMVLTDEAAWFEHVLKLTESLSERW